MAINTSNYNLKKPSPEDFYNIEDQNGNMDIIDAELNKLNENKASVEHNHNGEYETPEGAQSKADAAKSSANQYTDQKFTTVNSGLSSHLSDYVRQPGYGVTSGSANIYTLTLTPAPSAYTDGMGIVVKINSANTGAATVNVNGLGAKAIVDGKGNALTTGKLRLNGTYSLKYNSTSGNFILQGEGGDIPKLPTLVKNVNSGCWVSHGATMSVTDNIMTFLPSFQYGGVLQQVPKPNINDKIYIRCEMKGTTLTRFIFYHKSGIGTYALPTGNNVWQTLSLVTTYPSDGDRAYIDFDDAATNGWVQTQVKNVLYFNLTQMFGAGNEPSKEETDAAVDKFGGWWDSDLTALTSDANAVSGDILFNKISYVNGSRLVGSMPNRTLEAIGGPTWVDGVKAYSDGTLTLRPKEGYYKSEVNGNGYGPIAATDPNFIAANIVSGKSIFGVAGTGVGFPDGWNEVATARAWENITKFDPIVLKKMGIWENGVNKLTNPSVLPDGSAWSCSFSPDGNYLAITHIISPYLTIYKRSGDIFIKLINPDVLPDGPAWDCSFSPDSNYLAVAHSYSHGIIIYKRNGDTFTKLVVPSVSGSLLGWSCSFSTDGNYLAVGISISPYLIIYRRNGDTFTKLADPVNMPTSYVKSCSFSPDSNYLAVGNEDSPYLTIYKRNGDTFTKLADPAVLPAGNGQGCCFSPDGNYLAVGHYGPPYLTIYKRNGNTFTKLADPTILPIGSEGACAFSPDGNYLAVGGSNAPYLIIYKRNGDTFTKLPDPTNSPTSGPYSCSFSTDGNYLAVGLYGSPFLIIYKSDAYDSIQKITSKSQYFYSPPTEWKFGIAMETKSTGEIGKVTLFPKLYNLSNM